MALRMLSVRVIVGILINVPLCSLVELDLVNCGIDDEVAVPEGDVEIFKFPWLGILYYTYYDASVETRAVTTVALIQKEFVIAAAADVGPMPKTDFRRNSRVLLGEGWTRPGLHVRNYILHSEYGDTLNTVALVQLREPVTDVVIKPLCAPPKILKNPIFYVVKFKNDFNTLQKEVIPVSHVPSDLCKEFYVRARLYSRRMRPSHAACVVSLDQLQPCVWLAGAALVARDAMARWTILGLGVRGPGCGAPSRYLDMGSYYPWIRTSLANFQHLTVSRLSRNKYVLRRSGSSTSKFGYCDPEEKTTLLYQDMINVRSLSTEVEYLMYNMTIFKNVVYTCLTLELTDATATSEIRVAHRCPRKLDGKPCHYYQDTKLLIYVLIICGGKCTFQMKAWGHRKNMTLLDPQEWKWEEGSYYADFSLTRDEYRGDSYMTNHGFEPLDAKMWVLNYDLWTTTRAYEGDLFPTWVPKKLDEDGGWLPIWYNYNDTLRTPPSPTTTTTSTKTMLTQSTTTPLPRRRHLRNYLSPQRNYHIVPATTTSTQSTTTLLPRRRHLRNYLSPQRNYHIVPATTTSTQSTTTLLPRRRHIRNYLSPQRNYHIVPVITTSTQSTTTLLPRRRRL